MSTMNQVDIARIDPQRVEQVVTNRLVAIPTMPKLLALPIFMAAAAGALWRNSALVDVRRSDRDLPASRCGARGASPWCTSAIRRAVGLAGWRWLYTVTAVPTSFANGLMGGLFATLPADQERTLWTFALCLIVGWTPSRGLDGPTFLLSGLALLLPIGGVLVLHDGSRDAIGLAAIMFGFLSSSTCSPTSSASACASRSRATSPPPTCRRPSTRRIATSPSPRRRCAPCSTI